ncbi:MAG: class I SAM-dependent methyltransferase [Rhodanobacteraceae bacterium]
MNSNRLRGLLDPLRRTPLHPQWFVFRDERHIRRWVHDTACGRVLDVGCAGGWARDVVPLECEYIGLDYPVTACEIYGTRPQIFADGAKLPFIEGAFDTVLLLEVLEHVADAGAVLGEIHRVLKPGGMLLLSVPFLYPLHDAPHDYRRYTAHGLIHSVRSAGLQPGAAIPRNPGFEATALLSAIACAEAVLVATKVQRWRLIFAPLLLIAIPLMNILAWLMTPLGAKRMLASGHSIEARKPD